MFCYANQLRLGDMFKTQSVLVNDFLDLLQRETSVNSQRIADGARAFQRTPSQISENRNDWKYSRMIMDRWKSERSTWKNLESGSEIIKDV